MQLRGPAPFRRGGKILAKPFTVMWDAIKANQLSVDPSQFTLIRTPDGIRLLVVPREAVIYATITTACPAFASGTYGKGAATLSYASYSASGVGTEVTMGVGYPIYNGGGEVIPVGRRTMVVQVNGQYHPIVNFCPVS